MTRSEIVGRNIQQYRNSMGMSQVEFAIAIGRSQTMVSMYEKGKRLPSIQIILKIAEVLGVHFDDIYYSKDERQNEEEFDWYEEAFTPENEYPKGKYDQETIRKLHDIGDSLTSITKTKKWKRFSNALQQMRKSDFERAYNMVQAVFPEYFKRDEKK